MADLRFPKRLRLLRASDFERVFTARNSAACPWLTLYGATNEAGHARLGVTVSRRVGNAVARNRWKRLLRESFRRLQHKLPPLDLVCVVRAPAPPTMQELLTALSDLTARIERRAQQAARKRDDPSP